MRRDIEYVREPVELPRRDVILDREVVMVLVIRGRFGHMWFFSSIEGDGGEV